MPMNRERCIIIRNGPSISENGRLVSEVLVNATHI